MAFTAQQIEAVWQKANIVSNNNPSLFRKDVCSAWILRSEYGNRNSPYGWEIDHIIPNGNDSLSNLQPLHWQNNCAKGDGKLVCTVISNDVINVNR